MRTVRTPALSTARLSVLYAGLGLVVVGIYVTLPFDLNSAVFYDSGAAINWLANGV